MTDRDRQLLALRCVEVEAELAAIAEGRVVDGDPAAVEWELRADERHDPLLWNAYGSAYTRSRLNRRS